LLFKNVAEILGHASTAMTELYAYLMSEDKLIGIEMLLFGI